MRNEYRKWIAILLLCAMVVGMAFSAEAEQSGKTWILDGYETTDVHYKGFHFPMVADRRFSRLNLEEGINYYTQVDNKNAIVVKYVVATLADFKENREDAEAYYKWINQDMDNEYTEGIIEIDDHPALYSLITQKEGGFIGILDYVRNRSQLKIYIYSINIVDEEIPPEITPNDMKKLAESISYNESEADIRQSEGTPQIAAKEETNILTAGQKRDFWVNFASLDIKYNNDLNKVEWDVVDAVTGEAVEGLKINNKGLLTADKSIDKVLNVKVTAYSSIFHARGEYEMTVIPAVKKIYTDPAEVFLYEGSDTTVNARVILEPDTVPLTGIIWTLKKEGIVDMVAGDDGTAGFKALAAGKTQVTVKEPGGKSATVKVNVVAPVTGVVLTAKGKAAAGKTVTVSAALEPKQAGNKALEWSIDADESVATINAKGQLKISKDAVSGTVITVTCKALGAPKPVIEKLKITVE